MSCSSVQMTAKWNEGKTIIAKVVDPDTQVVQPLPDFDYVIVDFRTVLNGPLLLRLTTEEPGEITINRTTNEISLAISREQMLELAPLNAVTNVLFQIRWQDTAFPFEPGADLHWPVTGLRINPVLVGSPEPESV